MYQMIIVDDEEITRNAIHHFMNHYFTDILIAGEFRDGQEALDFLKEHPVDIILTDIRMPRMDGLALVKESSVLFPDAITMIISGYSEFEYARSALKYGVANYLLKPIDFDELKENIDHARNELDAREEKKKELDFSSENTELFFVELLNGAMKDASLMERRFNQLNFPFLIEQSSGVLMKLTLSKEANESRWIYGREQLGTALFNAISLSIPIAHIYPVFRAGNHYYYIGIVDLKSNPLNGEDLEHTIHHFLHIKCSIEFTTRFQTLTELTKGSITNELPPSSSPKVVSDDIVIQHAIDYISTHYSMDLTREDVADAVYLSSAYFSRFFKQKTGMSLFDYLTTVRMKKAIELLGTKMKINDIAREVGYQSRNRFFINFRQYTNYNPTDYRRKILKLGDYDD